MDKEEEEEESNQRTQDPPSVEGKVGALTQGTAILGDSNDEEQQEQEETKAGMNGHSEMTCAQLSWNLAPKNAW